MMKTPEEFVRLAKLEETIDAELKVRGFAAPITPIPWVRFTSVENHRLTPDVMCLWWIPCPDVQVFVGRVAHWAAADAAMVRRQTGSMVRAGPGAYFAIITEPPKPAPICNAIEVTADDSTATPQRLESDRTPDGAP